jgi:predicted NBD/HSP70 family sugar kinase
MDKRCYYIIINKFYRGETVGAIMDKLDYISRQGKMVLKLLQEYGPFTKGQLIQLTKMKLSTLNRAMQPLIDDNLIAESEDGQSTGGRRPALYDVNPDRYYIIGVDISRTYIQIVITNLKVQIVSQKLHEQCYSPGMTVKLVSHSISEMLKQLSIDKNSILGIGAGTVGPLDREKGIMTTPQYFPTNDWINVPLKDMLEEETGFPTFIDNGANTAVLAERLFGMGKGQDSMAYFNCGIGIRTGAINSGNIIRTKNNAEDVFGHMVVDVDGERCNCGNYGCIECYSSIYSITRKFVSELKKGRVSSIPKALEEIDYVDICNYAEGKDMLAKEVIENAAVIFGVGLANYINLINPQLVILSGPLIKHSDLFYTISTQTALKRIYPKNENKVSFSKGGFFGDYSMSVGATVVVMEEMLNTKQ